MTSNAHRGRGCWKLRTSVSEMCAALILPFRDCTHTLPGGRGEKEWNKRRERKKGKRGERESFGRDLKLIGTTHFSLEVIDECSEVFHEEWPRVNEEHSVHHHHHKTVAAERKHIKWGLHIQ